jgi:hypothetical protein
MASIWDRAKDLIEKHASNANVFLRLANDGDKVTGVFCGEPYPREVIWVGDRYETYDPKNPAHEGDSKRPSLRVALNFFVLPEGVMKVFEGSGQWFKDVMKVREKYGLEKWSFEIERHGESRDTKTKYTILPEERVDDQLRARIARTPLHDLEAMVLDGEGSSGEPAPSSASADESIHQGVASDLIQRMKALPLSDVTSLLGELGVQRVRDLRTSDVDRAYRLLEKYAGGPAEEIDPFA